MAKSKYGYDIVDTGFGVKSTSSTSKKSKYGYDISSVSKEETDTAFKNYETRRQETKKKIEEQNKAEELAAQQKNNSKWLNKSGLFDDGYQFGDILRTSLNTAGDIGINIVSGIASLGEGAVDAARYTIGDISSMLGNDTYAEAVRGRAKENTIEQLLSKPNKYLDKNSVLGEKSDQLAQGVGQVLGIYATGGVAGAAGATQGAINAIGLGTMGLSSYGSGRGQAYKEGATDKESVTYGLISAVGETVSEMMFGGLGKGANILGFNKGLLPVDDLLVDAAQKRIKSSVGKTLSELAIKSGAEGLEEIASGLVSALGKKMSYLDEQSYSELVKDENLWESFYMGALTSAVMQAPSMKIKMQTAADNLEGIKQLTENGYTKDQIEAILKEKEFEQSDIDSLMKATVSNPKNSLLLEQNSKIANLTDNDISKMDKLEEIETAITTLTNYFSNIIPSNQLETHIDTTYAQLTKLREKRAEINKTLSEQQKIEKIKQINEAVETTEEKEDNMNLIDKQEEAMTLAEDVDKNKKIKVASNKQKIKVYGKQFSNEAANIIEQLNMNIPEGQEPIQIVTELSQEQRQVMDLGSIFGKQVVFTQNMPYSGVVTNTNPNILFIDSKSSSGLIKNNKGALLYTLGHELFHSLKMSDPETYNEFIKYTKETITFEQITNFIERYDDKNANQILDSLKIDGKFNLEELIKNSSKHKLQNEQLDMIVEEMVANEFGGMITDKTYMNTLYEDNPSLFQKIINAIRELFKSLEGSVYDSSLTQLQVEKIRTDFENIVKEIGQEKTTKETVKIKEQQSSIIINNTIQDSKGNDIVFNRLHKNAKSISEDYDYSDNTTSKKTGYGIVLTNDEKYIKNAKSEDIIKTKIISKNGMLQDNNEVIEKNVITKLNSIVDKYLESEGLLYFGDNTMTSNDVIDSINKVSETIADDNDNKTARKAWVEMYDALNRDGYIKTEPDGSLLVVVVNAKQLDFYNKLQEKSKKLPDYVKTDNDKKIYDSMMKQEEKYQQTKEVTIEPQKAGPTLPILQDVKTSSMNLDDRYSFIEKNLDRYNKEINSDKKKMILNTTLKSYENYKKDGGTKTNDTLEELGKNQFKDIMKEKLNIKKLPKKEQTQKESKFYSNTAKANVNELFSDILEVAKYNQELRNYTKTSHDADMQKAVKELQEKGNQTIIDFLSKPQLTSTDAAIGKILLTYYKAKNDVINQIAVYRKIKESGTAAGQYVESLKIFKQMSPEAIVQMAITDFETALDNARKLNDPTINTWLRENMSRATLTAAEQEWIYEMANAALKLNPESMEYKQRFALIQKYIDSRIPKPVASKLKAYVRTGLLLNAKTAVRNVLGNITMLPANLTETLIGAKIDEKLSKQTGVRTKGYYNLKDSLKTGAVSFKKGIGYSISDYKTGINTSRASEEYGIVSGDTFNPKTKFGKVANTLEDVTSLVMDIGDRPFDEMYYDTSLQNQMLMNGVTEPTETMKQIAYEEAMKKTYKYDGKFYQTAKKIKDAFNVVGFKDAKGKTLFGLGDLVMFFTLTPANILQTTYEFSPAAVISIAQKSKKFKQALQTGEGIAFAQKDLADSYGKAITGTILMGLAFVLAKAGAISGGEDKDKDSKAMMRAMGYQPYSVKIGDWSFTYDWAQPIANPFAFAAEFTRQQNMEANNPNKLTGISKYIKTIGEAFTLGTDRLYEQSFLTGVKTLLSGDSISEGVLQTVTNTPAMFVPTTLKHIADLIDGKSKDTYDDSLLYQAFAKTISRVPGLKSLLPTNRNTLGQDIEQYGGANNIFNVMMNPANISKDVAGDVGQELTDVYNHTGENSIMPTTAPSYMDYDINSDGVKDRITFTPSQESELQKMMGTTYSDAVRNILATSAYQNASYDEKVTMLSVLSQYSKAKAIQDSGYVQGYVISPSSEAGQINKYTVEYGLSTSDALLYKSMINHIESEYDENGDAIEGTKNGTKAWTIMNMQISDSAKDAMLTMISPTAKIPETVNSLSNLYTKQDYVNYYSLSRSDSFVSNKFSRDDYDISTNYFKIDGPTYTKFAEDVSEIRSDYDSEGKVIADSKKNKVFNYINTLPLNKLQKLYLFSVSGYSVKQYKNELYSYINGLNISAEEKRQIWSAMKLD